ncbi:hypothetical protein VNO77_16071 [Canavalia gladiata]|uniref:Uncharacterized protein n=1 Tax=Canavalia gladiata TaxID=3824 RepID=A0AAN9QRS5_CANGL
MSLTYFKFCSKYLFYEVALASKSFNNDFARRVELTVVDGSELACPSPFLIDRTSHVSCHQIHYLEVYMIKDVYMEGKHEAMPPLPL